MKQGLSLRASQHLALTPQLQQSIRLLQLSTLELSQEVAQMLDDNPFLELAEDELNTDLLANAPIDVPVMEDETFGEVYALDPLHHLSTAAANTDVDGATATESEPLWDSDGMHDVSPDDSEWGGDAPAKQYSESEAEASDLSSEHISLQAQLHQQAQSLRLTATEAGALHFLIESLNNDGYLEEGLEELAAQLAPLADSAQMEELMHCFNMALHLLQSLQPVGVGARDLAECLQLQLRAMAVNDFPAAPTALKICSLPLDLLARRDVRRLMRLCNDTEDNVKAAIALIKQLEPKPGRKFINVERNFIVPDVIVSKIASGAPNKFFVRLNTDVMPRLQVHTLYANALKQHKGDSALALQQRLQEARWFIKNIQQRFDTILRVSNAIVERQKNFFMHGELAMRPLVLREIADELGLHESTISRVTTAKYMATPFGTYELKFFFGSGLDTESGGSASSTAVRALIKQFVANENPVKPLSDNQLSEMLKEQGIECARRTVAKYREALRIAPTNLRKAL